MHTPPYRRQTEVLIHALFQSSQDPFVTLKMLATEMRALVLLKLACLETSTRPGGLGKKRVHQL